MMESRMAEATSYDPIMQLPPPYISGSQPGIRNTAKNAAEATSAGRPAAIPAILRRVRGFTIVRHNVLAKRP